MRNKGPREDLKHLKAIVEKGRVEREAHERFKRWLYARENEIRTAPVRMERMSFWCDKCARDCAGPGYKEVRVPKGSMWFAFYRGFCPKGHHVLRRITDKLDDPYFYKSVFVRREQAMHADDFLTPNDVRFREVYPQAWADLKEREAWESGNRRVPEAG